MKFQKFQNGCHTRDVLRNDNEGSKKNIILGDPTRLTGTPASYI